jgi:4-hydroxy-tetrahydrodipicolinate reductase
MTMTWVRPWPCVRMVNAIPAVCAAAPGLLSAPDRPLITGAGLVRPVQGPSPDSRLF